MIPLLPFRSSLAAVPPLVAISLVVETCRRTLWRPVTLVELDAFGATCVRGLCVRRCLAMVCGQTLLTRHPASMVTPFALWVPKGQRAAE